VLNNRFFGLAVVILLSTAAYYPFLSTREFGNPDSIFYHYALLDSIHQLNQGVFPQYYASSLYLADGNSFSASPLYLFMGQLIYKAGLTNNYLLIQHLTILVSVWLAVIFTFLICYSILINDKWLAILIAVAYVTCPGVVALIYQFNMYSSYMALPYIPLVLFALYKIDLSGGGEWAVIGALSLTLSWLAHPPISLFLSLACLIICAISLVKDKTKFSLFLSFFALFGLMFLWQFLTVKEIGAVSAAGGSGTNYIVTQDWVDATVNDLNSLMPDVFRPFKYGTNGYRSLQLGYFFWGLLLIIYLYMAIKKDFWVSGIGLFSLLLILLLYPIYGWSDFLWSYIPPQIAALSPIWPNMRMYPILAGIAIVCLPIAWNYFTRLNNHLIRKFLILSIIILSIWHGHEYFYIVKGDNAFNGNIGKNSKPWLNKSFLHIEYGSHYDVRFPWSEYDPLLRYRVLDKNLRPINSLDNSLFLKEKCINSNGKFDQIRQSNINHRSAEWNLQQKIDIGNVAIQGGHLKVICFDIQSFEDDFNIEIWQKGDSSFPKRVQVLKRDKDFSDGHGVALFPIYIPKEGSFQLEISAWSSQPQLVSVGSINLIDYNHNELPIKVESFLPFKVKFTGEFEQLGIFEAFKNYNYAYKYLSNGREQQVLSVGKGNQLMLPLHIYTGQNTIELFYAPPWHLRYSFILTLAIFLGCIIYLISKLSMYAHFFRKMK